MPFRDLATNWLDWSGDLERRDEMSRMTPGLLA